MIRAETGPLFELSGYAAKRELRQFRRRGNSS